jgi:ATP-binding cassette subfamily F protein uup
MSLLSAQAIEKSHGSRAVLAGVSVTVAAGDRIGLVGDNGSGKTTLARILAGLDAPDAGQVMRQRGVRVGYLAQVPPLDEGLTVLETALAGLGEWRRLSLEHAEVSRQLEQRASA